VARFESLKINFVCRSKTQIRRTRHEYSAARAVMLCVIAAEMRLDLICNKFTGPGRTQRLQQDGYVIVWRVG
jgi:hypothetical protein